MLALSAAWVSALFYLAARLGVDPHVRLSLIDAAHVYVGLVGGVFILGKVSRVGFGYKVSRVPRVVFWHRWVSWSLLTLYSAIFMTGVLLLLPLRGALYNDLINVHLMVSVWAVVPTTWHVWHYRKRAAPFLTRLLPRQATVRFWTGASVALLPALILLAIPRAVSQLPQVMGGAAWSQAALPGSYLDRITTTPDGSLVSAGDALYVSSDGVVWTQIDMPSATAATSAASSSPANPHAGHIPAGNIALALAQAGNAVYIGASGGLYRSSGLGGPLTPLGLTGDRVNAVAIDPANPQHVWAGTSAGPMYSTDGGSSWKELAAGLREPKDVLALGFLDGRVVASDSTGVFMWNAASGSWQQSSMQSSVVDFTTSPDGRSLYATSSTNGVDVFSGGQWRTTASLASPHQHHSGHEHHAEVLSVASVDGRLYAAGTAYGVSASDDGGQTWTQLGGGLGDTTATQLVSYHGALLAATSNGIYRFPLRSDPAPTWKWWLAVIGVVVVCGLVGLLIAAPERWPRRKRSQAALSKEVG